MALTTVVKAIITADATKMQAGFAKAESSMTRYANKAVKTGKTLTKSLTLPIGLVGAAAVKSAVGFESSMSKIQSLVGLSAEAVEGFTKDVKGLAGETSRAPKELADAMFFITSAGLRGAEATEVLAASAKAAAVGLGDTATIADLATSAVNAYGSDVLSAADSTDVMVAAVREGKLEATELAGSMGRVLPVASSMGVSFNEVGAAFASMSRTGTNANEAATQLRSIMVSILKPTKQAEDALNGMGLSSEGLRTQMREEGLLSTLQTLSTEFDGNADAAAAVFGNVRALVGVMDLMGANAETTADIFGNMADVTGTLDTAFGVASETAEFKLNAAMSNIKLAFIDIGEKLIPIVVPAIQKLAEWVSSLSDKFSNLSPFMQGTIATIIGVAAAVGPLLMVGGKLLLLFGKLKTAALFLTTAIGATAAAVIALVALPLFFWWKSNAEAAADAKKRQEEITAAMVAAGDPASTLISRLQELNDEYREMVPASEAVEATVGDFIGSNVLLAELLDKKVATAFQDLAMDTEQLDEALRSGTNEFQELEEMAKRYASFTDATLIASLRRRTGATGSVTNALADQFEAEKITREELGKMLDALDETADGWDDHGEALEADAKAAIENATAQAIWVEALGEEATKLIESAGESEKYAVVADKLNGLMEIRNAEIAEEKKRLEEQKAAMNVVNQQELHRIQTIKESVTAVEEAAASQEELEKAAEEAADALEEEQQRFEDFIDSIRNAFDPIFSLEEAQDSLHSSIVDFADALIASETGLQGYSEEAINARAANRDMLAELANVAATLRETNTPMSESIAEFEKWRDQILLAALDAGATVTELEELSAQLDILGSISGFSIDIKVNQLFEQFGLDSSGLTAAQGSQMINHLAATGMLAADGMFVGASGAIVSQPTLSLIGEAGPEAVVPLNQAAGASPLGGMGGDTTVLNVTVQGSVLSEMDLTDAIQAQLIRTKNRNASLEFA